MDANTPIDSAENRAFLATAGLQDIATSRHPELELPRSYQAGSKCIDEAAGSKEVMSWVCAYGFYPFFQHGLYDHRGSMLDLDCKLFLKNFTPDKTRRMTHKLKASRPSEVEAYCTKLTDLLTKAGIFEKIEELHKGLYEASPVDQAHRIKKIKIYNSVTRDLMIAAENKLGPRAPMISHWSPTLKFKGQELSYYNECIKVDEEKGDLGASVHIPKAVTRDDSITCRSDLESKRLKLNSAGTRSRITRPRFGRIFLESRQHMPHRPGILDMYQPSSKSLMQRLLGHCMPGRALP